MFLQLFLKASLHTRALECMLPANIKMLSIQPAQVSVILFVDIFTLKRTGILHTAYFAEFTIKKTYFVFLYSLFLVFVFLFTSRFKYFLA
jgi:hypothetical protein